MKKLLIWGGNNKPLSLETMDSHASVNAYFLTKQLSKRAEQVINIVEMDKPELLLKHLDADIILSTFQYGFTSRIINKNKTAIFQRIRNEYTGIICSIIDDDYCRNYYEDILLTVLPKPKNIIKRYSRAVCHYVLNREMKSAVMGWSADADECFPESIPDNEFNVFIDHGPYDLKEDDLTMDYINALKAVRKLRPEKTINVYIQDNNGVVKLNLDDIYKPELYIRINKVPWPTVISYYRRCHVFCVTHRESAGLAVIEAAMCGAKIYVPRGRDRNYFISKNLLRQGVNYFIFSSLKNKAMNEETLEKEFLKDLGKGIDRRLLHNKLSSTNSWENAAENILYAIT